MSCAAKVAVHHHTQTRLKMVLSERISLKQTYSKRHLQAFSFACQGSILSFFPYVNCIMWSVPLLCCSGVHIFTPIEDKLYIHLIFSTLDTGIIPVLSFILIWLVFSKLQIRACYLETSYNTYNIHQCEYFIGRTKAY